MKIKKILLKRSKASKRVEVERGYFVENKGLEDDIYFGSKKEVVGLPFFSRKIVDGGMKLGLCEERFRETLLLETDKLPETGQLFTNGDVVFKVMTIGKRCFDDCKLRKDGKQCALKENTIVFSVEKSGYLKKNDILKEG